MSGQEQIDLKETNETFNVEDDLALKAEELIQAQQAIAAAKGHYEGVKQEMIDMLKEHERKSYCYQGQTISINNIKANETISIKKA